MCWQQKFFSAPHWEQGGAWSLTVLPILPSHILRGEGKKGEDERGEERKGRKGKERMDGKK